MILGNIITLSDDLKYVVTNVLNYQNQTYYLLVDVDNINNYKMVFLSSKDEVEEVDNNILLEKIVLLMSKNIINQ